jgi:CRP/FNR family cyclic AMP-dependent transcriptional regulator
MESRQAATVELLKTIPLFASLSPDELRTVAPAAREANVAAGEILLSQATPGREVLVLIDGAATVERDGVVIASVGSGEVIGEIGVLTRMSRMATVTTTAPSRLLVIEADAFRSLMERIPALGTEAWKASALRLQR